MSPGHRSARALVGALLPALGLLAGCKRAPTHAVPRNLLLISVDTLRADELGAYGATYGISPSIDALAESGVVFENAASVSSWTLPAFASILTSTYPSTHQVQAFSAALDPSFVTLGEVLSEAGFATAAVTSHAFVGPRYGMHQGIAAFDTALITGKRQAELKVSSPEVTARGVRWLEGAVEEEQRWFLWLHYFDPHFPYIRHGDPEQPEGDTEEDYRGDIAFTDEWIGVLLDELERLGAADDTLVVLLSDHGEEFRERKKLRHGFTLFREVVHMPFIARVPGTAPRRVSEAVSGVDVLPTVLELLDLPTPAAAVGRSLVPAMLGGRLEEQPILGELRLNSGYRADSLQLGPWKLVLDHSGRSTLGFAEYPGGPAIDDSPGPHAPSGDLAEQALLFRIDEDPAELHDVADEHPDEVARMRSTLEALLERARAVAGKAGRAVEHDADDLELLRQLGYVSDESGGGD
ncbi:MAG TPA: sulfatase [Planctomycetota bacterium]|nr:sulfatase [Planctomycetota bacterium]